MPVPSPRNSIRIARGNFADLDANSTAFGDGEFIYAIDQDRFYTANSGVLTPVGRGVVAVESIDTLADVDTTTIAPGIGSVLKWDGTNWVPGTDEDTVTSVNTQTGDVVLDADDISDATTTNKFTTQSDIDKLAGVESGATADQTDAEIRAAVDAALDSNVFTDADHTKLDGIAAGAEVNTVDSVAGRTGDVTLVKADVGLDNVDNTSDADKPVSTAQQTALDAKADLVGGVVPNSQLPSLAVSEYLGTVANEAALLLLSGERGDWAIRTDTGSTWVITTDGGSTITDWTELVTPADAVTSVNGYTGAVVLGGSDVGLSSTDDLAEGSTNLYSQWDTTGADIYYSSGRLLVGTSSGTSNALLTVQGNVASPTGAARLNIARGQTFTSNNALLGAIDFTDSDRNVFGQIECKSDASVAAGSDHPGKLGFSTTADGAASPTERMRLDSFGRLISFSTSANPASVFSTSLNGTTNRIIVGRKAGTAIDTTGTEVFKVMGDGDVENTNNAYTGISDVKLKENIVDAESQWSDLKSLQVRKYNFKQETGYGTHTQIGLIAQEVETVSPGLVKEAPDTDDDGNDLGTTTKSVNYSVLYMKAVKTLQEAMDRIETLEAKVAALEAGN